MDIKIMRLILVLATSALLAIAGCGGSGSTTTTDSTTDSTTTATPEVITLSGVAASGAAFVDAIIKVYDSTGVLVGTSSPVGTDGLYTVTLSSRSIPFIIIAARTSANGVVDSLVSVAPTVDTTSINVTPVTSLLASRLSVSGDPLKLAAEVASGTATVNATTVASKVAEVQQILRPILDSVGVTLIDPLSGNFSTNGTGYDRMLDSILVTINPGLTTANIEIGIKQKLPDGTQPTVIQFTSHDPVATIPVLPAIDSTTLAETGTSALIADFLTRLTACYALPLSARINTNGTLPSDIKADACRTIFSGNDPATYQSNGSIVGRGKAFNGIFVDGGTGVVFSQGTYEFSRENGDLVIAYKSTTAAGNEALDTLVVRKDTVDGKLKLIGNQYAYSGGISAYHTHRKFISLDQSAYDYRSTGYGISITDTLNSGASIYNRVEVTTPRGHVLTLKPSVGYSFLGFVKQPGVTETNTRSNIIRLRSVYDDTSNTANPADKETSLFYSDIAYSEADISALPAQSVFTFRYFLAGNTSGPADAIQQYKTRARPLTIEELKTKIEAQLEASTIADIQANLDPKGWGRSLLPTDGPAAGIKWTVPADALPPTLVTIFGTMHNTSISSWPYLSSFDDPATVGSTLRTGTVNCTSASSTDTHCGANGAFAIGALQTTIQLRALDSAGRSYFIQYVTYRLN